MRMKSFGWALSAVLIITSGVLADGLKVGVLAAPRGGSTYALSGLPFSNVVANYLGGYFPGISLVGTQTLTQPFLDSVDILFLNSAGSYSSAADPLTLTEQQLLRDFVLSGKGALVIADNSFSSGYGQSFANPFQMIVDTINTDLPAAGYISDLTNPVTSGPYLMGDGFVGGVAGYQDTIVSLGPYAIPFGKLASNGANLLAYIPENAMGPGSGRVVIFAEGDTAVGSLALDDKLVVNSLVYVSTSVPEASTFMLLGAALPVLAIIAIRTRGVRQQQTQ